MTKTFWGGIVAACAGLLGIFGIDVSADTQTAIINGSPLSAARSCLPYPHGAAKRRVERVPCC